LIREKPNTNQDNVGHPPIKLASAQPTTLTRVARMKAHGAVIRGYFIPSVDPDSASLHPGYSNGACAMQARPRRIGNNSGFPTARP
jgi:hypothetical protein